MNLRQLLRPAFTWTRIFSGNYPIQEAIRRLSQDMRNFEEIVDVQVRYDGQNADYAPLYIVFYIGRKV